MGLLSRAIARVVSGNPGASGAAETSPEGSVLDFCKHFCKNLCQQLYRRRGFCGILLASLSQGEGEDLFKLTLRMVSLCGAAFPLEKGRLLALVLLPGSLDRELLAHRLRGGLGAETPLVFRADSPETALVLLKPYL